MTPLGGFVLGLVVGLLLGPPTLLFAVWGMYMIGNRRE